MEQGVGDFAILPSLLYGSNSDYCYKVLFCMARFLSILNVIKL